MYPTRSLLLALAALSAPLLAAQTTPTFIQSEMPTLLQTYKSIHAHPELSHREAQTSAILADGLRAAGYTVSDHIGIYPDGSHAFGVLGLLKNGPGPTVLVRGDMDALPIVEETGLPYASHVKSSNASGQEVGVMHACGHDVHTTVLLGTARALADAKDKWHGTAMIVGQPSEETVDGAKAMLADHLYERFGRPDKIIGLHDINDHPAGTVALTAGAAMASSTSIDVIMRGIGSHGSAPQVGRDPVIMAAMFIVQLQTIVAASRTRATPPSSLLAISTAAPSATLSPTRLNWSSPRAASAITRVRSRSTESATWPQASQPATTFPLPKPPSSPFKMQNMRLPCSTILR